MQFDSGRAPSVRRFVFRDEPVLEAYFFRSSIAYALSVTWFLFVSFGRLAISWVMLGMLILSCGSTLLFYFFSLHTDLPLGLISVGIIFPVTLGVSFTLGRRENLLKDVAAIKSSSISLFFACRDLVAVRDEHKALLKELKNALFTTIIIVRQTLLHKTPAGAFSEIYHGKRGLHFVLFAQRSEQGLDWLQQVILKINRIEKPEGQIGTSMVGSGDFNKLVEAIERAMVLHDYRSPSSLRAFATIFLVSSPVILGPLYAFYSARYGIMSGVYSAIISTLILVALYRIFMQEEDPLDEQGFDDLSLMPMLHLFSDLQLEREDRELYWLDKETRSLNLIGKKDLDVEFLIQQTQRGPLFLMRRGEQGLEINL